MNRKNLQTLRAFIVSGAIAATLAACATEGVIHPAYLSNLLVRIDTQPAVAIQGENEVIVTAKVERRWLPNQPITGMHVHVRVGETGPRTPVVEHGHSGIYHCKVSLQDPHAQDLHLELAFQDAPEDPIKMIVKLR